MRATGPAQVCTRELITRLLRERRRDAARVVADEQIPERGELTRTSLPAPLSRPRESDLEAAHRAKGESCAEEEGVRHVPIVLELSHEHRGGPRPRPPQPGADRRVREVSIEGD